MNPRQLFIADDELSKEEKNSKVKKIAKLVFIM